MCSDLLYPRKLFCRLVLIPLISGHVFGRMMRTNNIIDDES